MKKILFFAAAVAAISFASCTGSANGGNENDSIVSDSITVEEPGFEEGKAAVAEIATAVQSGKAEDIQSAIEKAQVYVKQMIENGDAEKAAQYASQIKQFVKDHENEIKSIAAGNETLSNLVNKISTLPTTADEAAKALMGDAEAVKDAAKDAVSNAANDAVEDAKNTVKAEADKKVQEAKDAVKAEADKKVQDAKNAAGKAIDDAAKKLGF